MNENDLPDDVTIVDDADIWRRIPPVHLVKDEDRQTLRISTAAFRDSPDKSPMSVVLAETVRAAGRTAESVVVGAEENGIVAFAAGNARRLEQRLARTPTEREPAHGSVIGNKKPRKVQEGLRDASTWVLRPPDHVIKRRLAEEFRENPQLLESLIARDPRELLDPQ